MSHGVNWHVVGYAGVDLAEAGGQRGKTTTGRRDKRGSPVEPQAIGMAWVLPCRPVGARAAPCILTNAIRGVFGTAWAFGRCEVLS